MPNSILQDRLQEIVTVVFDGNTAAAAAAAEVEHSTLHRLLAGAVTEPRIGTIQKLARGYGVAVGWLLGEFDAGQAQVAARGPDETIVLPLPDEIWLIHSYHRTRQERIRNWLASVKPKTAEAKLIVARFQHFSLAVGTDESPFESVDALLSSSYHQLGERELFLIRRFAELESAVLEVAYQQARRAEAKGE